MTMKRLARQTCHLVRAEGGPSAVEYAVMLALIIALCLPTLWVLAPRMNGAFIRLALLIPGNSS